MCLGLRRNKKNEGKSRDYDGRKEEVRKKKRKGRRNNYEKKRNHSVINFAAFQCVFLAFLPLFVFRKEKKE